MQEELEIEYNQPKLSNVVTTFIYTQIPKAVRTN